jgi:hypothetical protein
MSPTFLKNPLLMFRKFLRFPMIQDHLCLMYLKILTQKYRNYQIFQKSLMYPRLLPEQMYRMNHWFQNCQTTFHQGRLIQSFQMCQKSQEPL